MISALRILIKTQVREFYALNAGYFLFFFFLFFGVVEGSHVIYYHRQLILGMISSPVFMGLVMLFWFLYNLKCIFFSSKQFGKAENLYLVNLQALTPAKRWLLFSIVHILLYLFVLIYSFVIVAMAFAYGHPWLAFVLIIFQVASILLGAWMSCGQLDSFSKRSSLSWIKNFKFNASVQFPFYLLMFTAYRKKLSFFTVKIFSFFLLFIVFILNKDDFDHTAFVLIFTILIVAHAVLPFLYIQFLENSLAFYRNLPVSFLKTGFIYILTYSIVLLPELIFLLINATQVPLLDILLLYAIALASLLLFTGILYLEDMDTNRYFKIVFVIFFASVFVLHNKLYLPMLGFELLVSALLFTSRYYLYEAKGKNS